MAEFEVAASCSNNAVRSIGRGYRYERGIARITPFRIHFFFRGTSPADFSPLPPSLSYSLSTFPPPLFLPPSSSTAFPTLPAAVSVIPLSISTPRSPTSSPSLFLLRARGVEQPSFVLVSLSIRLPSSLRRVCSGAHLVPEVKRGGIVAPVVLGTTTSLPFLYPCPRSCRRAPVDRDSNLLKSLSPPPLSLSRDILYRSRSYFGLNTTNQLAAHGHRRSSSRQKTSKRRKAF